MSYLMIACFVAAAFTARADMDHKGLQIALPSTASVLQGSAEDDTFQPAIEAKSEKKPCKCKGDSNALVCGIALDMAYEAGYAVPRLAKDRFTLSRTDGTSSLIYTLKRPPRSIA
ncbi:hypothetical protein ACFQ14_09140 [Pseudahrensia aquimaris]|uniref:Uncharacterized protein n=1 Tax=Pseudahrensia aquimaris TaxID=744461 RepID=A0ABW3FDL8_9HYPH